MSPRKARQVLRSTCPPLRADIIINLPLLGKGLPSPTTQGNSYLHSISTTGFREDPAHLQHLSTAAKHLSQLQTSSCNIQSNPPSNHSPPLCHRLKRTFFSSASLKVFPQHGFVAKPQSTPSVPHPIIRERSLFKAAWLFLCLAWPVG